MFSSVVTSSYHAMRLGLIMIMMVSSMAMAMSEPWITHVPNAEIVGKARFKVFLFKIYDATLFAPHGRFNPDGIFALRLSYLVDASKAQIVERSLIEMERQTKADKAQLQIWKIFLDASFRDLKDGESATAIHNKDGSITFYLNDVEGETINDADFADAFLNIWLSDSASDPDFSRTLRGLDTQS
ncbi:chalcone isomerase family protein [Alphaproteobacteria bacterium]|nr:chalcone isomerase family protein [Alphaproteobacteria bacterium]